MKYNKLIRDKIPDIISKQGNKSVVHILDAKSYGRELKKKLREEVDEFDESGEIEELADILEVVYALAKNKGVSQYQLGKIRQQKQENKGGFDQRIFLEEVVLAGTKP